MTEAAIVCVPLGERTYDIVIARGVMADAGRHLAALMPRARAVIVTDRNVADLHLDTLRTSLDDADVRHDHVIVPAGEKTKSFPHLEELLLRFLDLGIERGDCVVALGGGVVGDLAGLAASMLRRGIAWIQIPTTLLAQVDSSVGGKTGIDTSHGKNLVGTFHQPSLVLADPGILATLPRRELIAGYAEVVKYGLLGDRAFFEWLEHHGVDAMTGDAPALHHIVEASCAAKSAIVARDERESGARALLNLGHTFGHALEAESGYDGTLLHGEAVAIGMTMAFDLSVRLGLCPKGDAKRTRSHLESVGLPVHPSDLGLEMADAGKLIRHMTQDKKVVAGRVAFVLVRGIGDAFVTRTVALDEVETFLTQEYREPRDSHPDRG